MRFHGASGRFCTLLTPMSRKIGIPSDSMKLSYGVFGRPNLPKPARLPPVGSCQWVAPRTSCMFFLLGGERLAAGAFELSLVGRVHFRAQPLLGEFALEILAGLGVLVAVVDLVAAEALADPRLRHALRVADCNALVLEGEIARRRGASIEMLVQPHVR